MKSGTCLILKTQALHLQGSCFAVDKRQHLLKTRTFINTAGRSSDLARSFRCYFIGSETDLGHNLCSSTKTRPNRMGNQRRSDGMGGNPYRQENAWKTYKSPQRNFISCTDFEILGYAAFSIR